MLKKLYIEPSSFCNFKCEMCFRNSWFDESFSNLPYDVFVKTINDLPYGVETIFFGGMGEPFVHPKILDMLVFCKEKGYNVEILTNGSMLTEEVANKLMDMQLNKLWVSIDTLEDITGSDTKVAYECPLGHPNPYQILGNLKKLNHIRYRRKSTMQLGITFVVSKYNVKELAALPTFIDKYTINDVNISNMYPSNVEDFEQVLYQRTIDMAIGSDVFGSTRPKVNLPYMDFDQPCVIEGLSGMFARMNFQLYVENIPVARKSNHCRFIEEGHCFIRSDGDVSPCMALLHNGTTALFDKNRKIYHHSFGNVKESNISDIWNSLEYTEFRNRVKNFEFSPCISCGQCDLSDDNVEDCYGNVKPTCGACLWAEGLLSCP